MKRKLDDLKQKFHDKQYKLTPQRQCILQAFIDHPDQHLSAEDVLTIVRKTSADIGLATVYRTLEIFSDLDVLHKTDFGDGRSRYEMNESSTLHQHHHLICVSCGKVKEFQEDLLDSLENVIVDKSGFKITNHEVKFYGYCQECLNKSDK